MELRISSSILLLALTSTAFASHTSIKPNTGKFYVGIFGGGGSSNHINASQLGTAFFTEADGGPLSINAFGQLNHKSASFFGVQLGYQAQELFINSSSQWTLRPTAELEGYSMNKSSFNGTLVNNVTRLPEHDFMVSYPMSRNVFIANAVLSFDIPSFPVQPYIGFGIGNAIVRISNANATQANPVEQGINHYNANTNDTSSTFAGQIKIGFSYDINAYVGLFAEYRWLYLASTHFTFGSTVYPNHAETSSWQVTLDAQRYNLGSVGVRFTL